MLPNKISDINQIDLLTVIKLFVLFPLAHAYDEMLRRYISDHIVA